VRLGFPLFFTRKRSLHVEQLFSRGGARCLIALEPAAIGSSALIATLIDYKVVALPSRSTSAPCDPQTCATSVLRSTCTLQNIVRRAADALLA
jgi:hypothetical protein